MMIEAGFFDIELGDLGLDFGNQIGALGQEDQKNAISPKGFVGEFVQRLEFDARDFIQHATKFRNAVGFHLGTFDIQRFGEKNVQFVFF